MLNSCEFIGHLGADPETRSFQGGGKVCNFRLAVTEKWKKDGELQERTEWISAVVFVDILIELSERYLRKGSKVYIRGKWKTRRWQDQSGQDRYSTECVLQGPDAKIVLLDGPSAQRSEQKREYVSETTGNHNDYDEDIPF